MTPAWRDAFDAFDRLYAELPDVPCRACGLCCVNPHLTFVEFARLARHVTRHFAPEEARALLARDPAKSPRVKGAWLCRMQDGARCLVHAARPLACRLDGYPLMDAVLGRGDVLCPHIKTDRLYTPEDIDRVDEWVVRAYDICEPFHPVAEEPYFLRLMNLDCWWAAMLDPAIEQPLFVSLRGRLAEVADLAPLAAAYRDTTRLAEKLALIDRFWAANAEKDAPAAYAAIARVHRDFPRTETYFSMEARAYFLLMTEVLQNGV